jgi:polysaccharide export outer membrane protein
MKQCRYLTGLPLAALGILALLASGCQSQKQFTDYTTLAGMPTNTARARASSMLYYAELIHVGDTIGLRFSGPGPEAPIAPFSETVKEDGTITPPSLNIGPVKVVNKKPGELQRELQAEYNKKYVNLTVTVLLGERYYHVVGEVNKSGPVPYLGETDIIRAISAAGGFTEFANKKKIRLIHPNKQTEIINYNKAVLSTDQVFPVYPGDKIFVPRRWF